MTSRWEHFPHEADMGVRGFGSSKAQAFEQAALALTAIVTDPAGVAARDALEIECEAPDDELLLADWLNALILEMATRSMLFSRFEVRLDERPPERQLAARVWGEAVDALRHRPAVEVKGATYTDLKVAPVDEGWLAQTVVDV